jgi:hypothetical protein
MKDIILAWGINGFLALGGGYLVVSAIIARMIPIPKLMVNPFPVKSKGQRLLLGIFGLVLIFPTLLGIYREAFFGVSTTLTDPAIPEEVSEPKAANWPASDAVQIASLSGWSARGLSFKCEKVESFGLQQKNIRRLKYGAFQNKLYVYVGSVSSFGGMNNIYLLSSGASGSWPESGTMEEKDLQQRFNSAREWKRQASFQKSGDYIDFSFDGRSYRLTVSRIYSPLFGTNSVAIEICQQRG